MPVLKPLIGITGQSNSTGYGLVSGAPSGTAYDGPLSSANTGGGNAYIWWEVPALGYVELTGGASGSVDSITINGTQVLSGAVNYSSSLSTTATNVANNITAYGQTSGYRARANGAIIEIRPRLSAATQNGYAVVSSATTITTSDTNMSGGEDGHWEVLEFTNNHWDPQDIGTSGTIDRFGPLVSLALKLVQYYGHDIYFVLRGNGGKRIFANAAALPSGYDLNINSSDEGYDEYVEKFKRAMNSGVGVYPASSIMIHGEEDSTISTYANAYSSNITDFHNNFRSDIGISTIMCLQTQLGEGNGKPYYETTNAGMISWAALSDYNRTFKTAITLSGVHYSPTQYEIFGIECADDFIAYFGETWNLFKL